MTAADDARDKLRGFGPSRGQVDEMRLEHARVKFLMIETARDFVAAKARGWDTTDLLGTFHDALTDRIAAVEAELKDMGVDV